MCVNTIRFEFSNLRSGSTADTRLIGQTSKKSGILPALTIFCVFSLTSCLMGHCRDGDRLLARFFEELELFSISDGRNGSQHRY